MVKEFSGIGTIQFKFAEEKEGIVFSTANNNLEKLYNHRQQISDFIEEEIVKLQSIKEIEPKEYLNRYQMQLCEVYKLYYNENPNFSEKDIDIKVQSMMYMLSNYGINIVRNSIFALRDGMPYSFYYEDMIDSLVPMGEIQVKEITINDNAQKVIKVVGKEICNYVSNIENKTDVLKQIGSIDYLRRYCLSNKEEISEYNFIDCSEGKLGKRINLIKKIDNLVYEEN